MVSCVLGVDLHQQTEGVDSKIFPVIATRGVHETGDSFPSFLDEEVVWVDASDGSNALIGDGYGKEVCVWGGRGWVGGGMCV